MQNQTTFQNTHVSSLKPKTNGLQSNIITRAMGAWVMLRVALHLLWASVLVAWRIPKLSEPARQVAIQKWSRQLLVILGVSLQVRGNKLAKGRALLVCNHISWLDIFVLFAVGHCRFVSKADVQRWPIIGRLTQGVGTLFVDRNARRDAMRVVHHMADQLAAGEVLAVFPEGTTSDGSSVLPFHANLLQAAIASNSAIQPIALQYLEGNHGGRSMAPVYIGQDSLLRSLWRTVCASHLQVQVSLGAEQFANGRDRRTWAGDLRAEIIALRTNLPKEH